MNAREMRVVRWGAGTVVAAVLVTRGLPALWAEVRRQQAELEGERALLVRAEAAVIDLPGLEREAGVTRAALIGLAPRLLAGGTEAEAVADLTGRLALAAGHARTRILRTEQEPDSARVGRLRRVTLRLEVESDWSGIVGFLRGSLADPAVLPVHSVSVRGAEIPSGPRSAEVLSGQIEISGWYLAVGSRTTIGGGT